MTLLYIILSISVVSVISLIGIVTLFIRNPGLVDKIIFFMVSFATGALLGAAFLDLLPEAVKISQENTLIFVIVGIMLFFVVEKFLFWRHCHIGECKEHAFTYMNLMGSSVHNFIDGMIIATAFLTGVKVGLIATIAIVMHEIPRELGDFGVLCYGGFSKAKALFCNFLTVLTAFLGAFFVYIFSGCLKNIMGSLLAFAAGGFIYIACTDLIPELHKEVKPRYSFYQFILVVFGVGVIWIAKLIFE